MSYLSQNNILMLLSSMKIDQIQIIAHSSETFGESRLWYEAKSGPWILLSAESV